MLRGRGGRLTQAAIDFPAAESAEYSKVRCEEGDTTELTAELRVLVQCLMKSELYSTETWIETKIANANLGRNLRVTARHLFYNSIWNP